MNLHTIRYFLARVRECRTRDEARAIWELAQINAPFPQHEPEFRLNMAIYLLVQLERYALQYGEPKDERDYSIQQ